MPSSPPCCLPRVFSASLPKPEKGLPPTSTCPSWSHIGTHSSPKKPSRPHAETGQGDREGETEKGKEGGRRYSTDAMSLKDIR